jgi:hypothetical protein
MMEALQSIIDPATGYSLVIWAVASALIVIHAIWKFVRNCMLARRERAREEEEVRVRTRNRMRRQLEVESLERALASGPSSVHTGIEPPLDPPLGTSWVDPRTGYLFVHVRPRFWRSVSGQTEDFYDRRPPEGFPRVSVASELARITTRPKPLQPAASKVEEPFSLKRRVRIKAPTTLKRNAIPLRKLRMPD